MASEMKAWAVRMGAGMDGAEGTLSLSDTHLVFDLEEEEGSVRIPLKDIRKAKRIRGSPILMVDADRDPAGSSGPVQFAFYAVEPPRLRPEGRTSKGKLRRQSIIYLQSANTRYKDVLAVWERELRAAAEAARQG
jgi:hypothetical protein